MLRLILRLRLGRIHAARGLGVDRHALEAMLHVRVVEVLGVELLDGRARRDAALTAEPTIERLQRHDAVRQHERGHYRGE